MYINQLKKVFLLLKNAIIKYDLENKAILKKFILNQKIFEMTFSSYLNCFILVGKDNKVQLIDKNELELNEIVELKDIQNINNIDISNDGKLLFFSQKSTLFYYNLLNKQMGNIDFPIQITNIKVLKQNENDTECLSVGDFCGKIHNVTINNNNKKAYIIQTKHWHSHKINAMNISPNGQYLFTGGKEGVIVFWNIINENRKFLPRMNSEILKISISPNSSIAAVLLRENKIKFINLFNNSIINEFNGICLSKNFTGDNIIYGQFKDFNSLVMFNDLGIIQIYNLNKKSIDFSFNVIEKNFVSNTNNEEINNKKLKMLCFSQNYEYFLTYEELSYNNNFFSSFLKFWKISILENNFTVKLICLAENPHSQSITKLNSSINTFSTISKDNLLKIWKLNHLETFECCFSSSYKNNPIQSVEIVNDMILAIVNNTLVCWEKLHTVPVNFFNLTSKSREIFYSRQGKEIIIYSESSVICFDILDWKVLWEMDFIEFIVLKITGNYKSIILYLQNKNDANKKILLDVEIKTKKILRTIALFKKGVRYLFCVNGSINSMILVNSGLEIMSVSSEKKRSNKLLKNKKASNGKINEKKEIKEKKDSNLNDDDLFGYQLKKINLKN